MKKYNRYLISTFWLSLLALSSVYAQENACPDLTRLHAFGRQADELGAKSGYPIGSANSWNQSELDRVGSFSNLQRIGRFGGNVELKPSLLALQLPCAPSELSFNYQTPQGASSVDAYLARQRITGLLVLKDGQIQIERYQYDRNTEHKLYSASMSKTLTAIAVLIAKKEGLIRSLDDKAKVYAKQLDGTEYGETTLRNLLRMGSGIKFKECNSCADDDIHRVSQAISRNGIVSVAKSLNVRAHPEGSVYNYNGADTHMLSLVMSEVAKQPLHQYLEKKLWQPIGAKSSAFWVVDKNQVTVADHGFSATLRDWSRLGIALANNLVVSDQYGQRIELVDAQDWLDATQLDRAPKGFGPGFVSKNGAYGYQMFIMGGKPRRFMLLGIYGQSIFVDPALKLVMVQTGVAKTPSGDETKLSEERFVFWANLVKHYGGTW